jgi:hypothetical protein
LTSSTGALASAQAVDVNAKRGISADVVLTAVAALLVIVALIALAVVASTSPSNASTKPRRPSRARSVRPSITLGLRAARRGSAAIPVLAGSVVAVSTVAATLVFGASLNRFTDDPDRYGWPFDAAALVNAGYDKPNVPAITKTLDDPDSGVSRWGRAALSAGTRVNGVSVPFVGERDGYEAVARTRVVEGRLPTADDEVALGKLTADDLRVQVGDEVEVTSQYGTRSGTVVGLVILPAVGALESDRASLGTGLLLPPPFMDQLMSASSDQLGMSGAAIADSLASFVVIDLDDGIDHAQWLQDHSAAMLEWDPFANPPLAYAEPVRPPVVVDVSAMEGVPALLAGVFVLAMSAAVVTGIATGTRARRRELAIVRALGASKGQVRASVRWHALAVVAFGLAVGLPVGVALGRVAYSAFAGSIGATAEPVVPPARLGALVVITFAVGLGAATLPGRWVSSRSTVSAALRAETAAPA